MNRQSLVILWRFVFSAGPVALLLLTAAGASFPVAAAPPPLQAAAPDPVSAALLPDPPRQNDPWTPPVTTLTPQFVAATRTLFRQGLADPRGGEYREITVQMGDSMPGWTRLTQVHGWVLPREPAGAPAFAVCWNGLVYPVLAVGAPSDLKADVDAMVRGGSVPTNNMGPESEATSLWALSPLRTCLLLRLGEASLAEKVWAAQPAAPRDGDPYLRLASDWTWGQFRRVLDLRQKGDDPLALFAARRLTRIRARVEGEAAERRLPLPTRRASASPAPHSYLEFLDRLPELVADQEARARATKHTSALLAGQEAFPSKAAYIDALIGDLDEVKVAVWETSVSTLGFDPTVRALADQGEDAVEPLIHSIGADPRLVRNVGIDPVQRRVYFVRVARAAFAAVSMVLQSSTFGDGGYRDDDSARTAASVQQYWDKQKNSPPAERWYQTLADDQATPQEWQEAADAISRPTGVNYFGDVTSSEMVQPGVISPLRGEALRGRSDPSVSELMARRIPQIAAIDRKHPWTGVGNPHRATLMALDAARWDARASVPALRAQADYLSALPTVGYDFDSQRVEDEVAVTLARIRGGDTQALSDYAAWLLRGPLPTPATEKAFEPLWRFPRDPAVTAATARLFGGSAPPWLPTPSSGNYSALGNLSKSPLLGETAFRRHFLAALGDKTVAGTIKSNGNGWWGGSVPELDSSPPDNPVIDPLRPKAPWATAVRRCDVYAWQLSRLGGMPRFEFFWPLPRRDAVIAQAAGRLRLYGSRFEYEPKLEGLWSQEAAYVHSNGLRYLWDSFSAPLAHLSFPLLDRPATPAEAARGEAIFSLAGEGERRTWPLPHWPLPARWVSDHRYPQAGPVINGKPTTEYQQEGLVWQAEEVRQKGQWKRFYGFVGPHDIARVPAEHIEFPPDNPYLWQPFSPTLDGKTSLPGSSLPLPLGHALPVTLNLRCRSSREQQIPGEWQRTGANGPALRKGVTLGLIYSPIPFAPGAYGPAEDVRRGWVPLRPVRTAVFDPTPAVRQLIPTQEVTVMHLDLRDWYGLTRPGFYRLTFRFDGKSTGSGKGYPLALWFELAK